MLFDTTLRSVLSQTDSNFRFIVVCNHIPNITVNDPRLIFHVVNFPPLSHQKESGLFINDSYTDKGTKLMSGLLLSQRLAPDYIYIIDADDWVNRHIVQYLHSQFQYPVWYADAGYYANYTTNHIKRRHGMIRYCGSTFAYKPSLLMKLANISFHIDEMSTQEQLLSATSDQFISQILGNHQTQYRYFSAMGIPPKPFPFRAVSWVIGTEENISQTFGGRYGLPIDKTFCNNFGLPHTFISPQKPTPELRIREALGCICSKIGWIKSQLSAKDIY